MTVFQDIKVLAVTQDYVNKDQPYDASERGEVPEGSEFGYITLTLTPQQAQLMALLVFKEVAYTVTLRPFGDDRIVPLDPIVEPIQLLPF